MRDRVLPGTPTSLVGLRKGAFLLNTFYGPPFPSSIPNSTLFNALPDSLAGNDRIFLGVFQLHNDVTIISANQFEINLSEHSIDSVTLLAQYSFNPVPDFVYLNRDLPHLDRISL
jgi:hypothetical protein